MADEYSEEEGYDEVDAGEEEQSEEDNGDDDDDDDGGDNEDEDEEVDSCGNRDSDYDSDDLDNPFLFTSEQPDSDIDGIDYENEEFSMDEPAKLFYSRIRYALRCGTDHGKGGELKRVTRTFDGPCEVCGDREWQPGEGVIVRQGLPPDEGKSLVCLGCAEEVLDEQAFHQYDPYDHNCWTPDEDDDDDDDDGEEEEEEEEGEDEVEEVEEGEEEERSEEEDGDSNGDPEEDPGDNGEDGEATRKRWQISVDANGDGGHAAKRQRG